MILARIVLATTLTLTTFTSGSDDLKELRSFVHKLIENINAREGKAFQWHCQRKVARTEFSTDDRELGRPELTPLGECGGAVELEIVS